LPWGKKKSFSNFIANPSGVEWISEPQEFLRAEDNEESVVSKKIRLFRQSFGMRKFIFL
jgi:hypothetical protein